MEKQLIINTMSGSNIKTTKKTKVTLSNGTYIFENEYIKGDKVVSGKVTIVSHGVTYVEEVDFVEKTAK